MPPKPVRVPRSTPGESPRDWRSIRRGRPIHAHDRAAEHAMRKGEAKKIEMVSANLADIARADEVLRDGRGIISRIERATLEKTRGAGGAHTPGGLVQSGDPEERTPAPR